MIACLGRQWFIWLTGYRLPFREAKAGIWKQDLKQSPRRSSARGGTTHNGLGFPPFITGRGNALQICPQFNLIEATPQLKLPLPKRLICGEMTAKLHKCPGESFPLSFLTFIDLVLKDPKKQSPTQLWEHRGLGYRLAKQENKNV